MPDIGIFSRNLYLEIEGRCKRLLRVIDESILEACSKVSEPLSVRECTIGIEVDVTILRACQ
ncbi:MAG: hypothetical protein ACI9MB_000726 [Verrucomicrobiales bacterium]